MKKTLNVAGYILVVVIVFLLAYYTGIGETEDINIKLKEQQYQAAIKLHQNLKYFYINDNPAEFEYDDWCLIYEKAVESCCILDIYKESFDIVYSGDLYNELNDIKYQCYLVVKTKNISKTQIEVYNTFSGKLEKTFRETDYFIIENR